MTEMSGWSTRADSYSFGNGVGSPITIYGTRMREPTETTVYRPEADYRRLKAIARKEKRTTAQLARDAVAEYAGRAGGRLKPRESYSSAGMSNLLSDDTKQQV